MANLVRRAYDELIDLPKGAAVASGLLSLLLLAGAGSLWRSGSWWALPAVLLAVGAALLLVLSLRWGLAVERGQTDELPPTDQRLSAEPPSNVRRFD